MLYAGYKRVSTNSQEGGFLTQDNLFDIYEKNTGNKLHKIFGDYAKSGKKDREEFKKLKQWALQQKEQITFVVQDIDRFSRSLFLWVEFQALVVKIKAKLFVITDNKFYELDEATDKFTANIKAVFAEFKVDQEYEKSQKGMQRLLNNGIYIFGMQRGYKKLKGQIIVRDSPIFELKQKALLQIIKGELTPYAAWKRLRSLGIKDGKSTFYDNLKDKKMYGYFDYPKYDIYDQEILNNGKGKFPRMLAKKEFDLLQASINPSVQTINVKNFVEFKLRSCVNCGHCDKPLITYFAPGRSKSYPYYKCNNRRCDMFQKSISRWQIEDNFFKLLHPVSFKPEQVEILKQMAIYHLKKRFDKLPSQIKTLKKQLLIIEGKYDKTLDKMIELGGEDEMIIESIKEKLRQYASQKVNLNEKIELKIKLQKKHEQKIIMEKTKLALDYVCNPTKIVNLTDIKAKKIYMGLIFKTTPKYFKNVGYETAEYTDIYAGLRDAKNKKKNLEVLSGKILNQIIDIMLPVTLQEK